MSTTSSKSTDRKKAPASKKKMELHVTRKQFLAAVIGVGALGLAFPHVQKLFENKIDTPEENTTAALEHMGLTDIALGKFKKDATLCEEQRPFAATFEAIEPGGGAVMGEVCASAKVDVRISYGPK